MVKKMQTREDEASSIASEADSKRSEARSDAPTEGQDFASDEALSSTDLGVLSSEDDDPEIIVENKRRSRILLFLLIGALLVSLGIIVVVPPFDGAAPARSKDANFDLILEEDFKHAGQAPHALLRYAPVKTTLHYGIELEQTVEYEQGKPVLVKLSAQITVENKRGDRNPDAIILSLSEVKLALLDGDEEVDLASISRMVAGLSLVGRLDEQLGIGRVLPLMRVNPQVGRVLYILSDLLRMVWTKLPSQPVGEGASWGLLDSSMQELHRLSSSEYRKGWILAQVELLPSREQVGSFDLGEGAGTLRTKMVDGRIVQSSGKLVQEMHMPKIGLCKKTSSFTLKYLPHTDND